jgi:hypothetical protein
MDLRNGSPLRVSLLIAFVLASFALSPHARATCQEGCLTNENTVLGDDALLNNTGSANTAIGFNALYSNTSGFNNTATGAFALASNTGNFGNTATGAFALYSNNSGGFANTATGSNALFSNTTGVENTATGFQALFDNTTGDGNTADGVNALANNTTGNLNTATGSFVLSQNTTGFSNTANGFGALGINTTGRQNTANGADALLINTTGGNNIALGFEAGARLTTGSYNIDIGNAGAAGEGNTIRIGKQGTQRTTFIAGISGVTVAGGVGVIIDSNGQLGTIVSSERFKDVVKPMDKASEAILALNPVTFRYKKELDPAGIPQFGLVAEDVAKVNPDLVARDEQGKPYTVRYEAVNAMLLNEFLKEHRKVEALESTVAYQQSINAEQQKEIQALTESLTEQASQIQKVSAQLQANKRPQQTVVSNP